MHKIYTLDNIDVQGKRVLVRVDLNVPIKGGQVLDDERMQAILPGLNELIKNKAIVILCSHFGRPKGKNQKEYSLKLISEYLSDVLKQDVVFIPEIDNDMRASLSKLKAGQVALLENLRFYKGEEENSSDFAKQLAALADIYINDAFSVSHRSHASVDAITHLIPSYSGRLLEKEITALKKSFDEAKNPIIAVIGGAKISTKLEVLKALVQKVSYLIPAGGIANTFLLAHNKSIGKSLCEPDLVDMVKEIEALATEAGCSIVPPRDVVVTDKLSEGTRYRVCAPSEIHYDEMIVDFGPNSVLDIYKISQLCRTFIWNGPLGVFEIQPFDMASKQLANYIADLTQNHGLYSVAGGGETLAVLNQAKVKQKFSYVSTAGGAFLEWLEGKKLPGIEALKMSTLTPSV